MKSPYKSQRFWSGVAAIVGLLWALLPLEWQHAIADAQSYVSDRLVQGESLLTGGLAWGFIRGMLKNEAVDWRRLLPRRKP